MRTTGSSCDEYSTTARRARIFDAKRRVKRVAVTLVSRHVFYLGVAHRSGIHAPARRGARSIADARDPNPPLRTLAMNTKAKTAIRTTAAKGALLGGALVVTGFAAAADLTGASAQAAKSLDVGFAPLVDTQAFGNQSLFIAGVEHKLVFRDENAWLLGADSSERPAADGFYRLSNNQILKIAGGKVFQQSVVAMATCCWKDWLRKVQSRTPGADADVQSVYISLFS
jgi:hypothetical protein